MNFAQGDMTKFEAELEKIRAKAIDVSNKMRESADL